MTPVHYPEPTLAARAARVLRDNDTGSVITAAPRLYPHMWSWDAAFISIGLAHLHVRRAIAELDTLFAAQWADGMVPHIVFTGRDGYFPGPDRWGAPAPAPGVRTSGICQPPIHAIAVQRVLDIARAGAAEEASAAERFARRVWPALYAWHRWLARYRVDGGTGLVTIVHGWESGMDNSPRWDAPYAAVRPGPDLPPYTREDLRRADPGERPTDAEYDRYLWLIEGMRRVGYDAARVVRTSEFLVGDVFITALFALANDVLAELGESLGYDTAEVRAWASGARAAVAAARSPSTGPARDYDVRAGRWLETETIAGFAPLLCGSSELFELWDSPRWAGNPDLVVPIPPSTTPSATGFDPRRYWRGPQWPVLAWLFGWSFHRHGWAHRAAAMREAGIRLTDGGAFGEYYHPFTGEPLGSTDQSWTAAVVLDWLCA